MTRVKGRGWGGKVGVKDGGGGGVMGRDGDGEERDDKGVVVKELAKGVKEKKMDDENNKNWTNNYENKTILAK